MGADLLVFSFVAWGGGGCGPPPFLNPTIPSFARHSLSLLTLLFALPVARGTPEASNAFGNLRIFSWVGLVRKDL